MVDLSVSKEIELLVDTVRRFVETEVQPLEERVDQADSIAFDEITAVKQKARDLGLFAMNIPSEYGGGGLDAVSMCMVHEQLGRTTAPLVHAIFGQVYDILTFCNDAQKPLYLLPAVRGEKICAMAITEPDAGSDVANISTTAVADGDDFVINGVKHFISDGDAADFIILLAMTDRDKRARGGMTLFFIDRDTPGFRLARTQKMMGQRGVGHAELVFENCRVSRQRVLGTVGDGFRLILSRGLASSRLYNVAARCVGMATRVLEISRDYANQRQAFGQPIGQFQMIQSMLADMATEIFATRCMVLNTAWEIDQGVDVRTKISMVKLFASEMLGRIADRGVQIMGGMGYTTDHPMERIYRDARIARIWEGTSEIHRWVIARQILQNNNFL